MNTELTNLRAELIDLYGELTKLVIEAQTRGIEAAAREVASGYDDFDDTIDRIYATGLTHAYKVAQDALQRVLDAHI